MQQCEGDTNKKNRKTTTIHVSIEVYDELDRIKTQIEEILNTNISFDQLLRCFLFLRDKGIIATI